MSHALRLLAVSTFLATSITTALAEVAPACPGGGTATGTFNCTGPVFFPTCTEGPPWKCTIVDDDKSAEMGGGDGPPPRKFDFVVAPSLSGAGGAVFEPGGGGGGGGPNGHLGDTTGPAPTVMSDGGSGPTLF